MAAARWARHNNFSYAGDACTALLVISATLSHRAQAETAAESARFSKAYDITLDGHLSEPAWMAAQPLTKFFETFPRSVAEPAVQTEARFLYDDKYVYIGVTAREPDPNSIRSGFVRRDSVTIEHDYIEVMLDPLNTQRNALVFTANPSGVRNDGAFSEEEQRVDTRPDLDFDVETSVNERNWQAEFRIPLATLRYRAGDDQSWRFVIYRNRPRVNTVRIQSSPEPRQATCTLCFAGEVRGISIAASEPPMYVTPQVVYARNDAADEIRGSIDAKWVPRSDTVVDLTLWPDFSQIEADDLQLTANAQFALAVKEKRPFFLEGTDLLSTPILAVYTRSFAEPQAGVKITHRGDAHDYSALILRDQSGGIVLEPGALGSGAAVQPFDSTAMVGRYKQEIGDFSWGILGSARLNDGARGGANYVYGMDGTWSPTNSDRITVQALASKTTNPDRPELLPSWDGRQFDGTAYSLMWQHSSDKWFATWSNNSYSAGFRTWNGFMPQVDVSAQTASTGLFFYPQSALLSRVSPGLAYISVRELGGRELSAEFHPNLSLTLPYNTQLAISWSPQAKNTSFVGARTYDYWSVSLTTTPVAWMPGITVASSFGDGIDFSTGRVNEATSLLASVPLRLDRLELITSLGYQAQDSRDDGTRLFTQQNVQFDALWHFSSKLYLQALYQDSRFHRAATTVDSLPLSSRGGIYSALLSYQTNWQTRYFVGVRHRTFDDRFTDSSDTEVFAKFSYVLSKW